MEIDFKNNKLKKICENNKQLQIKYGKQQAEIIIKRIGELQAAENLDDISKLPQARMHKLSGGYDNHFAVDLKHPYRLIFFPKNGDSTNLKSITSVKIIEACTNYH